MAGYSGTPLVKKLGFKTGWRVAAISAPRGYRRMLGRLPAGLSLITTSGGLLNAIHFFVKRRSALERSLPRLVRRIIKEGMIWVSWPKGSSGVKTDLNENIIRTIGLGYGLVDIKVVAVDETWSGLKFVYRRRNRK